MPNTKAQRMRARCLSNWFHVTATWDHDNRCFVIEHGATRTTHATYASAYLRASHIAATGG